MDKVGRYFLFGLFALVVIASFVSAAPGPVEGIKSFLDGVYSIIQPVTDVIFGTNSSTLSTFTPAELLLVKVLFLVVAFSVCFLIFEKVPLFASNRPVLYIFTIAVSLLATRWITNVEFVQTVLLPYTALGVALSAGIPFFAWFMIVDLGIKSRSLRRIAWVFFALIFTVLWFVRWNELSGNQAGVLLIYPFTAIIALIMAIADGTIQRLRTRIRAEKAGRDTSEDVVIKLKEDLAKLPELVASGTLTAAQARARQKKIIEKLQYIGATFSPSV